MLKQIYALDNERGKHWDAIGQKYRAYEERQDRELEAQLQQQQLLMLQSIGQSLNQANQIMNLGRGGQTLNSGLGAGMSYGSPSDRASSAQCRPEYIETKCFADDAKCQAQRAQIMSWPVCSGLAQPQTTWPDKTFGNS